MCFPSGGGGGESAADIARQEAEEARKNEEARQSRIKTGMADLDAQFSLFNDAFYGDRKQAYLDYYAPQVDDQYKSAQEKLTYAFARNGNLNSTAATDEFAKLLKDYDLQKAGIVSKADADNAGFRSRIANEKSALTSQLNATGDAARVSNEALGRTQVMFNERPSYDPLGDIFAGVGNAVGNYNQLQRDQQIYDQYFGRRGNSGGSGRMVQ